MKYNRLFNNLHKYATEKADLNLGQFKEICRIFWLNMTPTEQNLFEKQYYQSIIQITKQESMKTTLERVKLNTKK